MSQHDFDVDGTQLMPAALTDLNAALKALASLSSDADEPGTTFAYMLWFHETTGILKQRNAADDGWIELWNLGASSVAFKEIPFIVSFSVSGDAEIGRILVDKLVFLTQVTVKKASVHCGSAPAGSAAALRLTKDQTEVNDTLSVPAAGNSNTEANAVLDTPEVFAPGEELGLKFVGAGAEPDAGSNFTVTLQGTMS